MHSYGWIADILPGEVLHTNAYSNYATIWIAARYMQIDWDIQCWADAILDTHSGMIKYYPSCRHIDVTKNKTHSFNNGSTIDHDEAFLIAINTGLDVVERLLGDMTDAEYKKKTGRDRIKNTL